ncbi:MAG: hypothetical protein P8Z42_06560 [Anaerolineales bacterium]|jgi:two-component system response regulator VicR
MKGSILLQESDSDLRKVLALYLENLDWRVLQSKTKKFAVQLLEKENPTILITELDPAESKPDDLIKCFRAVNKVRAVSILILTTFEHLGKEIVRQYRPDAILHKPFDVRTVGRKIERLLDGGGA